VGLNSRGGPKGPKAESKPGKTLEKKESKLNFNLEIPERDSLKQLDESDLGQTEREIQDELAKQIGGVKEALKLKQQECK
jgi:hypothetical protein